MHFSVLLLVMQRDASLQHCACAAPLRCRNCRWPLLTTDPQQHDGMSRLFPPALPIGSRKRGRPQHPCWELASRESAGARSGLCVCSQPVPNCSRVVTAHLIEQCPALSDHQRSEFVERLQREKHTVWRESLLDDHHRAKLSGRCLGATCRCFVPRMSEPHYRHAGNSAAALAAPERTPQLRLPQHAASAPAVGPDSTALSATPAGAAAAHAAGWGAPGPGLTEPAAAAAPRIRGASTSAAAPPAC